MKNTKKDVWIFGFDSSIQSTLKEIVYFAGAEPYEFEEGSGFSKIFKTQPPVMIVMSIEALEMLDFHLMAGGDPQFDKVAIVAGVGDVYSRRLRRMIDMICTDFFLISNPYHLKRITMAVMSQNPWSEAPATSGRLLIADDVLERRIAIARSLRIMNFDVEFAESRKDVLDRLQRGESYTMVLSSTMVGEEDMRNVFKKVFCDACFKRCPWIFYEENQLLANVEESGPDKLIKVGNELSPETIAFNVQSILSRPLEEMRKSERLPYFTPVCFEIERIKEQIWGYSSDISEDGLYIRTTVPPPPNTMLTISFRPPMGEGTVKLGARVAWRKEYGDSSFPSKRSGCGVEFVRTSKPDRAAVLAGYNALKETLKSCKV